MNRNPLLALVAALAILSARTVWEGGAEELEGAWNYSTGIG